MSATLLTEDASSTSKAPPSGPTIEALEEESTTLAAHIGAAEYRLLRAVGEFEARGASSCHRPSPLDLISDSSFTQTVELSTLSRNGDEADLWMSASR